MTISSVDKQSILNLADVQLLLIIESMCRNGQSAHQEKSKNDLLNNISGTADQNMIQKLKQPFGM